MGISMISAISEETPSPLPSTTVDKKEVSNKPTLDVKRTVSDDHKQEADKSGDEDDLD